MKLCLLTVISFASLSLSAYCSEETKHSNREPCDSEEAFVKSMLKDFQKDAYWKNATPEQKAKFIQFWRRGYRENKCIINFFEAEANERQALCAPTVRLSIMDEHAKYRILDKSIESIGASNTREASPESIMSTLLERKSIEACVLAKNLKTEKLHAYRLRVEDDDTKSVVTRVTVDENFDIDRWLLRKQNEAVSIFWYELLQKPFNEITATVPKIGDFVQPDEKYQTNVGNSPIGSSETPNQTPKYAIQLKSISGNAPDAYLIASMRSKGDVWKTASWEVANVVVDEEQTTLHQNDRDVAAFAENYIHASEDERSNLTENGFKSRLPSTGKYTIFGQILVLSLGEGKWKARCKLSHSDNFGMKSSKQRRETIWFYVKHSNDGKGYVVYDIEVTTKGGK